ncbi:MULTISPECIES: VOC family protein [Luteimonas]|uniref:VOC family protein n=1 Tax=Luteimonas TaxID=83614 RepID=UPI000C7A8636|nr:MULTISPECIES: VOC family protein [Luteimonas]
MQLLINLDVPDLAAAEALYTHAFDLRIGRRLGDGVVELLGAAAPIYLLRKAAGTPGAGGATRDYRRHWCPLHLDVVVDDLDAALARAEAAGLHREGDIRDADWGRIVALADPFGHGWCMLQFRNRGYDALVADA